MDQRHQNGLRTELYLAHWYAADGCSVYWPLGTQSQCDFIIEREGKLLRVQAKTATRTKNNDRLWYLQCRLVSRNKYRRPYTKDQIDLIVFYDPISGKIWEVPIDEIERLGLTSITLEKNGPNKSIMPYNPENWLIETGH